MRSSQFSASQPLAPLVCGFAAAVFLVATVVLSPDLAQAQDKAPATGNPGSTGSGGATCSCPQQEPETHKLWPRPKFAGTRPDAQTSFDPSDEVAALEAVHLALTEVGDGAAYVWHRRNGRLSGVVKPTTSFKDARGQICRHIVMSLSAGSHSRTTEGVACRLENGTWQLEG